MTVRHLVNNTIVGNTGAKICTRCGKEKELGEFAKQKSRQDGHAPGCKQCCRQYYREHYSLVSTKDRQMLQNGEFIGVQDTAKQLGISTQTLKRLDKSGEFRAIHTSRGRLLYSRDMTRLFSLNRLSKQPQQPQFENSDNGKRIELTRGLYALVSPDDYEFLSQFDWMAAPYTIWQGKFSARIQKKYSTLAFGEMEMHRVVWRKCGFPKCCSVYHINNNGLDNRRENLTDRKPNWLLAHFEECRQAHPPQLRQRGNEQIPIENPDNGRLLTLQNGLVIAVDDDDFGRISKFNWHVTDSKTEGRITIRANVNGKSKSISQVVMNSVSRVSPIYLNGNPFDNRKKNIRDTIKNTGELDSMGIGWITARKCYSFKFPSLAGRLTEYFASPILDDVIEFKNELFQQICDKKIFCLGCRIFMRLDDFEDVVCKIFFAKSRAGHRATTCNRKMDREEKRRIYMEFRNRPCTDCGKSFPYQIMHSHHVDRTQKKFEISTLMKSSHSPEQLLTEINKCVVLCPNCHLEREWGENGSLRIHFWKKYSTG